MHQIIKSKNLELEYAQLKVGEKMVLMDTKETIMGTSNGYFKFNSNGELIEELYNTVAPFRKDDNVYGFQPLPPKEIYTTQVDEELTKAKSFLLRDLVKVMDYEDSIYIYFSDDEETLTSKFYDIKELSTNLLQREVSEVLPVQCESIGVKLK